MEKDSNRLGGLSSAELLERRNEVLERHRWHDGKRQILGNLERWIAGGASPAGVIRGELHDARREEQRAREDLERIERELKRREDVQLELWASAAEAAA